MQSHTWSITLPLPIISTELFKGYISCIRNLSRVNISKNVAHVTYDTTIEVVRELLNVLFCLNWRTCRLLVHKVVVSLKQCTTETLVDHSAKKCSLLKIGGEIKTTTRHLPASWSHSRSFKVIRNYTDELIQTAQVSRLLHVTKYCRKLQCSG